MGKVDDAALARARVAYMLELARGCSYISSTLTPETLDRAVAEVLGDFLKAYGTQNLGVFQKLLAQDLERRGNRKAASAVRNSDIGNDKEAEGGE
jgi:hypothetical protein